MNSFSTLSSTLDRRSQTSAVQRQHSHLADYFGLSDEYLCLESLLRSRHPGQQQLYRLIAGAGFIQVEKSKSLWSAENIATSRSGP
jgi:hypothetical protein